MQIILRPRQMGKTTELIRMSAETFTYIIVRSKQDATRIFHQAKEMGLDIPFPLTFQEFISGEYFGKNIKGFLIDNADDLLQSLSKGVPVQAISVTGSHLTQRAADFADCLVCGIAYPSTATICTKCGGKLQSR